MWWSSSYGDGDDRCGDGDAIIAAACCPWAALCGGLGGRTASLRCDGGRGVSPRSAPRSGGGTAGSSGAPGAPKEVPRSLTSAHGGAHASPAGLPHAPHACGDACGDATHTDAAACAASCARLAAPPECGLGGATKARGDASFAVRSDAMETSRPTARAARVGGWMVAPPWGWLGPASLGGRAAAGGGAHGGDMGDMGEMDPMADGRDAAEWAVQEGGEAWGGVREVREWRPFGVACAAGAPWWPPLRRGGALGGVTERPTWKDPTAARPP